MPGSANTPNTSAFVGDASYVVAGTGTSNDGRDVDALVLMDPATGLPYAANAVTGNIASAATDSGNPVKIGGVFNTAQPTVTTGQRVDAQMTARGAQIVATGADAFAVSGTVGLASGSQVVGSFVAFGNAASGSTDSAAPVKIGGVFNTAQPTVTTGQRVDAQMTARGAVIVASGVDALTVGVSSLPALATGSNTIGTVIDTGNAASGATDSGNPVKVGAVYNATQPTVTTGQRVDAQATARGAVIVATGSDTFSVVDTGNVASGGTDSGNPVKVGGIYNSTQPTFSTGQRSDLQLSLRGAVLVTASVEGFFVQVSASPSGGYSQKLASALTNTAFSIKASAGSLAGYHLFNTNSAVVYVQLFDATAVTVGTTTPTTVIGIPASDYVSLSLLPGIAFVTGIMAAATTTATGSTAPTTALVCTFFYK